MTSQNTTVLTVETTEELLLLRHCNPASFVGQAQTLCPIPLTPTASSPI